MSLEDDLEPKLVEINRLANEWYAGYLRYWGWEFNRYGEPAPSPAGPPLGAEPANPQQMREDWHIFRDNLLRLLDRFRDFYGTQDVYWLHERLGGSIQDVGSGTHTTVHGRISLAYDPWVQEVGRLVETQDWVGPAAETFYNQFNKPFTQMAALQMAYVRELAFTARGYHELLTEIHEAVLKIADACIGRLKNPGLGSDEAEIYFYGVGSLILAIFGLWWTPAGWASLALAGRGFAMTDWPERPGTAKPPPIQIMVSGANAVDAVLSTHDALTIVEQVLADGDKKFDDILERSLSDRRAFENPELRLPRPGVADGERPFTAMRRGSPAGTPLPGDEVVVSIVQLHQAGKVNLSIAAEQYAAAAGLLDSCAVPTALQRFLPRSVPKFEDARGNLKDILANTSVTLTDVGAALIRAADDYQLTDEKRAEVMRQLSTIDPPRMGDEPERAGGV